MARSPGRGGYKWRKVQAIVRASSDTCWRCGHYIDQTLDHRHPLSSTVDHVIPLSLGGDPLDLANLRHAHRRCNSRRGNRIGKAVDEQALRTSRPW